MKTPTSPDALAKYDSMPAKDAVLAAWSTPGNNPGWHRMHRRKLHEEMPLLARALDRLEKENQ